MCTGSGTYPDPYIIEDLVIIGGGWSVGVMIDNSEAYFRIKNCTFTNLLWGIMLRDVKNAQLFNNTCSSHFHSGIWLSGSNNNTITGNTLNNNNDGGIYLYESNNNIISDNTEYNNYKGINLLYCENNIISRNIVNSGIVLGGSNNIVSGNIMNGCGFWLNDLGFQNTNLATISSIDIDTTNLVNGKPLYYYCNESNLGPNNFTNAGQVVLVNCRNSIISNLNLSGGSIGITLIYSDDNVIVGNIVNNNRIRGISLSFSNNNNTISGNIANFNNIYGIYIGYSDDCNILENNVTNNGFSGIYIDRSHETKILENNVNYNNLHGFEILRLKNSDISDNNVNYNEICGFYLTSSFNNTITGNSIIGNQKCIVEVNYSEGLDNIFENNTCRNRSQTIPGYNIFFLVLIVCISSMIFFLRNLSIFRNRNKKRYQQY